MTQMFKGCTNLTNTPIVLLEEAETLNLESTFENAANLQNTLETHALVTINANLNSAFKNCTSLMDVSSADFLDDASIVSTFTHMFDGCTNLQSIDDDFMMRFNKRDLPASYYSYMFQNCAALLEAPSLEYDSVNANSMDHMFYNCSSLQDASKVHIKGNLYANYSYDAMFSKNSSLTILPAFDTEIRLADDKDCFDTASFRDMFRQCISLEDATSIKLDITGMVKTEAFMTFMSACSSLIAGPSKLLIDIDNSLVGGASRCFYGMFQEDSTMQTIGQDGFSLHFKDMSGWGCGQGMFYIDGALQSAPTSFVIEGLADGTENYAYAFTGCGNMLLDFANVRLDVESCGNKALAGLFDQCYKAVGTIDEIPCMSLNTGCYMWLFRDCWHMGPTLPKLPATDGYEQCYEAMFWHVGNPAEGGTLPTHASVALESGSNCTTNMFAHMQQGTATMDIPVGNPYGWYNVTDASSAYFVDKAAPKNFVLNEIL